MRIPKRAAEGLVSLLVAHVVSVNGAAVSVKAWQRPHVNNRWAHKSRVITPEDCARAASPREVALGYPVDPVPPRLTT